MTKLLIVSALFPPEPVVSAKLSYDIASFFAEQKQEVSVLSPKPTRPLGFRFGNEIEQKFNFQHIRIDSYTCPKSSIIGRFRESYSFGKKCYNYIVESSGIQAVYANTWPLAAQYYTVKAAVKKNIPIIIHVQDIYPESLTNKISVLGTVLHSLLLPIDKYILQNATHVITISENMKQYLAKTRNIKREKITVVQNWQDDSEFVSFSSTPLADSDTSLFTFMYLGNIGPVAGVDVLIDAFANARLTNSRLIIAGSGSMKEHLIQKAQQLKDCKIEFWDVPEGKVAETQALADILLLPVKAGAASSSIPSKLPAYMLSKKTILASVDAASDTAACIRQAGCGYVVEPENKEQLASYMSKVKNVSKETLQQMGEKGFTYANQHFTKAANLNKIAVTIENTITAKA